MDLSYSKGHCKKLGATFENGGINFAIYCKIAKTMELLLFKSIDDMNPRIIKLDSANYKTSYYFHVFVEGLNDGQIYAWRVSEIIRSKDYDKWDPCKVLMDPYAHGIAIPKNYTRAKICMPGSNIHCCPKSVAIDVSGYDWEGDAHPNQSLNQMLIYEMHVKGFTADPSSGVPACKRGTYAGVIEKIPYLKQLGVSAVELLPVYQFDDKVGFQSKVNYWGYDPISFFVPHPGYSSDKSLHGPINEFRDMVKALHKAGIEVYLDVVYNHTSESGKDGPMFNFKGLARDEYYITTEDGEYMNFTGCGNTVNAQSPVTKNMIRDSMAFWVEEMHVDGFRFDLASILSRNSKGVPVSDAPALLDLDGDYRFANVKLIAEAWDAAGLYQVGSLPGTRWREWNGQFRDVMRRFVKGDSGLVKTLVHRVMGSPDIYSSEFYDPYKSVNFVTCHDGFTLWDLVSYNQKYNHANGEENRDGTDQNFSWNCGAEGETEDPAINRLRLQQAKNLMFLNLTSIGTTMILMGDEILRSQAGNNNPYCQDNSISYMNWNLSPMQKEMLRFTSMLSSAKHVVTAHETAQINQMMSLSERLKVSLVTLHGVRADEPDFSDDSHTIGLRYYWPGAHDYNYVFINSYWEPLYIELPDVPNGKDKKWYRVMDTGLLPPDDVTLARANAPVFEQRSTYRIGARSIVMFSSMV